MARTLSEAFEKDLLQITGRLFAVGPEITRPYVQPTRRQATALPSYEEPAPKEPRLSHPKSTSQQSQRAKRQQEMAEMETLIQTLQASIAMMERKVNILKGEKGKKKDGVNTTTAQEMALLDTRPMTVEEKRTLSLQVSQLDEMEVEGLLNIVKGSIPEDQSHQEDIELDFNMLPNEVLRQMERYIKECKEAKTVTRRHRTKHTGVMGNPSENLFNYDDDHFVEDFDNSGRFLFVIEKMNWKWEFEGMTFFTKMSF